MIRIRTTVSEYTPPRGSKKYILLASFLILLAIIVSLTVFFIAKGRKYKVVDVRKDKNNNVIQIPDEHPLSSNIKITNTKYFRIGAIKDLDTKYIESILDEVGNSLKSEDMRNKLMAKKPIFLIGDKVRDFREFDYRKDYWTTADGRNAVELSVPFVDGEKNIGYLSSVNHLNCNNSGLGESNIVLHEALHFIEYICLEQNHYTEISRLYKKYNIENNNYATKGMYQFSNEYEFFACFADFYINKNSNEYMFISNNSYNNNQIIKEYMPELYTFYENLFENTDNLIKTICNTNCLYNICPR